MSQEPAYLFFPPLITCQFCHTTQNGFCIRPACIDARLAREEQRIVKKARKEKESDISRS